MRNVECGTRNEKKELIPHSEFRIPHSAGSVGNWATTLPQKERCCGFDSHLSHLKKCGIENAECGIEQMPFIPHSEFRIPHSVWLGRQLADQPDLKFGMLWVQLPPEPKRNAECRIRIAEFEMPFIPHSEFRIPHSRGPVRLSAKDTRLSSWKEGFDSLTGRCRR